MPPKKGKKDKGAKSDLSSLKNDEAKMKAIEEAKAAAKQKQMIEDKNTHLNTLKIQNKWKEIMKYEKSATLTKDIDILRQTFMRQLDQKNNSLSGLEKGVSESEEQLVTAIKLHLTNMDTLIDLQARRVNSLQGQYEDDLANLNTEFSQEKIMLLSQQAKEKADILGIMARMEMDFQDTEADAKHEYSSLKYDAKNKNIEEKHALRIQLESTVEDLWRQFQLALTQYTSSTDERKRQFEELKQRDTKNAKEIEHQMKRLVKLQENIAHLKAKLNNSSKDSEERSHSLKEEKEAIQVHFQNLKHKMNAFREEEKRKLTSMTVLSNSVIKELASKVEKAEQILKLSEMNRKLETEPEKVLLFNTVSENDEAVDEAAKSMLEEINLPQEYEAMEQFYKRFNKVMLDKLALEKQKRQLHEENEHLRNILKQYLEGISLTDNALSEPNPLVIVNGNTNAPIRKNSEQLNVTYVEAAHQVNRINAF